MQTNDVPIWPNATIQFSSSDLFRYYVPSGSAIEQIVEFYQNETRKQGWIAEYEPLRRDDQAVMSFRDGGRSVTVIVEQAKPDQVRVMVRTLDPESVPSA
jgi:hypothetical protein